MKQVSRNRPRKAEQEQDETQSKEVRDEQLAKETEELLAEVDCCLAGAEDDRLAEKKAAKAEWDELHSRLSADELPYDEFDFRRREWAMKYDALFDVTWCCGTPYPDFTGLE